MKNFAVINYQVYTKDGTDARNITKFVPNKMTRRIARKIKNVLNVLDPSNAPYRIAEVRITK